VAALPGLGDRDTLAGARLARPGFLDEQPASDLDDSVGQSVVRGGVGLGKKGTRGCCLPWVFALDGF